MSRRLAFPAIIPVRNAAEEELAAAARASLPLQAGRRLADWFGDDPVDAESGWRSAHAQRDAAVTVGLAARGDTITDETTSRLRWIYEVAYHAGYLHTSEDHELIHRAGTLCDAAERTNTEIIADWCRALDALFAHGVEDALPPGADPAPLDFAGIGNYPILKLLEQHGTATAEILSAEIGEGATEGMTPSSGRLRWSAWTARYGDPTAAFLRLAAEFGVVTVDGSAVSLTPLGGWAVIHQVGAKVEVLPASAALTPIQLIICRLGMSGETFEQELHAWLAAREPAGAVTALLEAAAEEDAAYLTTGVQIAAGIEGDTEAAWLSAMSLPAIRPYAVAELNQPGSPQCALMPQREDDVECCGSGLGVAGLLGSLLASARPGGRRWEAAGLMPRFGSSRRGWLMASYAGAAAFFALEAVAREPGEASGLAATESDQGTTRLIVAAYGVAAGLSPVLRRLPAGRMPPVCGPAGVGVMAAGLALRAWSMRALGPYYSRTLRTTSDQVVVESGPYRVIRHPGYLGSIMIWTGFGVASGSAAAALGVAALLGAAYSRRIASEEDMLTGKLGTAYAEYSQRTKRLIPFIW